VTSTPMRSMCWPGSCPNSARNSGMRPTKGWCAMPWPRVT
jgi:hypothetical protein